ncbi:MAG: HAD family hydrolase [Chloroflexi bacterium]|nr:HAD family hydrolase [Chloroflexota bacterium]
MLSDLTAVTFDLWQTLLMDNRELGRARAQVRLDGTHDALSRWGETYDVEHIREAYRACYRECHRIRDQQLDVSFREQVEIFINNIDAGLVDRLNEPAIEEIARVYADSFFVHPPVAHANAQAVLRDIKAMGLRIGLISNTGMTPGATFRQFLDQQGMLQYFDVLTFSDEVKLAKPSNQIFLMTLDSLDATPAQTVHVGDHVQNDVVGAKRCGLKTIWITGFYENDDPNDPDTEPDATVGDLAEVVPAIAGLATSGAAANKRAQ